MALAFKKKQVPQEMLPRQATVGRVHGARTCLKLRAGEILDHHLRGIDGLALLVSRLWLS